MHGSTLFICWDVVGLRLYAYCCLYSTMDTEARHRVCIGILSVPLLLMKNLLVWEQILSWCLLVIVIESFAMGTDTVLVFACNSGCMPESCTDLLFSCWDVFGLRLCASCCLYSTMVTETRHRLCIGMFKSFYMG